MKNKFKYILIFALIILAMVFTGCTKFNINASIDEDNLVTYSYEVVINGMATDDINYNETKAYLGKMMKHWNDSAGFVSELESEDNLFKLTSEIEKQCDSRKEAFATLYEYMTNSVTPFINVEYDYNQNFYYEDYSLKATIHLDGIVDDDIYTVFPSIVGEDVDEFFSNLECNVTLSLPQNDSDESDEIIQNIVEKTIPIDSETEVAISGIINNNVNVRYERDLLAKREIEQRNIIIFSIAGALISIFLILLIVFRKKRNKAEDKKEVIPENEQ